MQKFLYLIMAALLALPATAFAVGQEDAMISELQKQIEELSEELEELNDRVDFTERHATLDRIEFTGDLRVKADSLHYKDVTVVEPPITTPIALTPNGPDPAGFNMNPDGTFKRKKSDLNNDVLYTTRLRLNMKAKIWDNVKFNGRLLMYKNWGDSTGTKVFDSWDSFTMDGTNSGNTTDDTLHVERAFFDWSNINDSNFYLSIGRRPSTYGPPANFRENELRGGTPSGHLVNFNFDGITAGYKLGEITGWEGQTIRFCYGQGFESEYGNGELWGEISAEDTHLGGFNIDALNDGNNLVQLTAFRAQDISDGFKGTLAIPSNFLPPSMSSAMMPGFNLESRYYGTTNIGDLNLAGIGYVREQDNGLTMFGSFGWTRTDPNGKAGMFGGLLSDAEMDPVFLDENDDGIPDYLVGMAPSGNSQEDKAQDGYSVYVGLQTPAPFGKFGVEYNYGSKYWMPFTQAQDDVAGSKLATRGHVGEVYYVVDINPRMFLKFGALYYDYEYTGSGSPVGKPQKVDDVQDGKAFSMLPAVDKVIDYNASLTMTF